MTGELRELLRGLPVLTGRAPEFNAAQAPDDPVVLFADWLRHAAQSGRQCSFPTSGPHTQ
jgi:pyridoxamine 5'-phosphate oxidase